MTSPAAPSPGAATSPMTSTAPRRRALTDKRRCRFQAGNSNATSVASRKPSLLRERCRQTRCRSGDAP
jgi:hypothetical protein